jgi:hypothetical protein
MPGVQEERKGMTSFIWKEAIASESLDDWSSGVHTCHSECPCHTHKLEPIEIDPQVSEILSMWGLRPEDTKDCSGVAPEPS